MYHIDPIMLVLFVVTLALTGAGWFLFKAIRGPREWWETRWYLWRWTLTFTIMTVGSIGLLIYALKSAQ